jgi:hypothetical protein
MFIRNTVHTLSRNLTNLTSVRFLFATLGWFLNLKKQNNFSDTITVEFYWLSHLEQKKTSQVIAY